MRIERFKFELNIRVYFFHAVTYLMNALCILKTSLKNKKISRSSTKLINLTFLREALYFLEEDIHKFREGYKLKTQ